MKETREYYDRFSAGYDRRRNKGYHVLLDELEAGFVRQQIRGRMILDAGCGTGLVSAHLKAVFPRIIGGDLSSGMLRRAAARGQTVVQADLTALLFQSGAFDGLFSFKVLAHVPRLKNALEEMARVVKPGGGLILEFYNPRSIRGLKKRFHIRHRVANKTDETEVYTGFYTLRTIREILPQGLKIEAVRGIMIFTPLALLHRIPVLGKILAGMERRFCDGPLRRFGGFIDVATRKSDRQG